MTTPACLKSRYISQLTLQSAPLRGVLMVSCFLLSACGHLGINLDGKLEDRDSGTVESQRSDGDGKPLGVGGATAVESDGGGYIEPSDPPRSRKDASVDDPPVRPRPRIDASLPPVLVGRDGSAPPTEEEPKRPLPPVLLTDAGTPQVPSDSGLSEDGGSAPHPIEPDGSVAEPEDAGVQMDASAPPDSGPDSGEPDAEPPVVGPKKRYCEPECSCPHDAECDLYCLSSPCWPKCGADADCKISSGEAEVVNVECSADSVCKLYANGDAPVQFHCEGEGSCYGDCQGVESCKMSCEDGNSCVLECGDAEDCAVECGNDASCSIIQQKSDTETSMSCGSGELRRCANGVTVCNRRCVTVGSVELPL